MKFVLQPSLERNALVKLAATLWNQSDIRTLVSEFSNSDLFKQENDNFWIKPATSARTAKWKEIEDKVIDKMKQLIIPKSLKGKIIHFIHIVGLQISRWMQYHRTTHLLELDLPNEFYWSSHGTIDKKRTAVVLVNDDSIRITTRYKLACIYCLEEDVLKLWDKMRECQRKHFYNVEDPSKVLQHYLVVYWTYIIKGQLAKIESMTRDRDHDSVYRFSFRYAAACGNKAATEYFLQKITPNDRSSLMKQCFNLSVRREYFGHVTKPPGEYYCSDVLIFLLSQMNEKQQKRVFKRCSFAAFECFLDWPFQFMFAQATHLKHVLSRRSYNFEVFMMIYRKVLIGCKDYDYEKMFGDLWQQMSEIDKRHLLDEGTLRTLLPVLLFTEHEENLRLIMKDVSEDTKEWFPFNSLKYFYKDVLFKNSWDTVKGLIRLCVSSKDEVIRLKEKFEQSLYNQKQMHPLFQFLDDLISEYNKRKCENEEDIANSAKKICSSRI